MKSANNLNLLFPDVSMIYVIVFDNLDHISRNKIVSYDLLHPMPFNQVISVLGGVLALTTHNGVL